MTLYRGWRGLGLAAGVVVLYLLLAVAGHELGFYGLLSVFYPPAGLALAAGLLWRWKALPLLALGELLSGIIVFDIGTDFSWVQMIVNAVGYAAIYVLAAVVLRRLGVGGRAASVRDAVLILTVGLLATFGAALFGVGMQQWADIPAPDGFWSAVGVWWIGDAIGIATVTPTLLLVALGMEARPTRGSSGVASSARIGTVLLCLALPAVVAVVLFNIDGGGPGLLSLVFVPVLFIAVRYGLTGAALSTLVLAPVLTELANDSTLDLDRADLQLYILGVLVVGLIVGAVVDERQRAALRSAELGQIVERTTDLVAIVDRSGRLRYLNAAGRRLLGLAEDDDPGRLREEDYAADALSAQSSVEAREIATQRGVWDGDVRLKGADGRVISGSKVVVPHTTPDGRVLRTASVVRDVSEQRALEEELARLALEDSLTGLANRALFLTQVERAIEAAPRVHVPTSLFVVQLDRFAGLRQAFDGATVDDVLRQAADRLRELLGAEASIARVDVCGFGVLPHRAVAGPAASALARSIIEDFGDRMTVAGQRVPITVSVGVAEITGESRAGDVLRAATIAADRAEANGGAGVVFHAESMTSAARTALAIEGDLRDALAQRSWAMHYQPIVDAVTCGVLSVESLLRLVGHDSPAAHISVAEDTGLIVPLGLQILEQVCRDSSRWSHIPAVASVHVNVSGRQLEEPDFATAVAAVLSQYPDAAPVMTIEVTETVMSSDPSRASLVLDELRELGATVALDDFGTGYSSLATLHTFPIDIVKLDRAFTLEIATSERMRAVVATSIELAHALGMTVVAEGIAEPAQLDVLRELGCDAIQGYLIARPLPLDELLAWLQSSAQDTSDPLQPA